MNLPKYYVIRKTMKILWIAHIITIYTTFNEKLLSNQTKKKITLHVIQRVENVSVATIALVVNTK